MIDANPDDFRAGSEARMDEQLMVKFFLKEREDKAQTLETGSPKFKEVEYIEIRVPGQRSAQVCRPATYRDKQRFPKHYDMFQKRIEAPEEGTPLGQWPQVSRSQVEELAFLGIKSVESVAAMADVHAHKMHGGLMLKRRAAEWLEESNATALIAEKEALQTRIADLEASMKAMMAEKSDIEEETSAKPARRSRKQA
jgi:hypothetical protein